MLKKVVLPGIQYSNTQSPLLIYHVTKIVFLHGQIHPKFTYVAVTWPTNGIKSQNARGFT